MSEYAHRRDFLFCKMCGTMLDFKSAKYAECPLCHCKRPAKEIAGREISYTVTAEDIQRELNIEQFVHPDGIYVAETNEKAHKPTAQQKCIYCGAEEVEYESKQMRGADEGETKIYHCLQCGETFQEK